VRNRLLCLLVAALPGCATTQPEQLAQECRPGGELRTESAPKTSVYALYRVADAANQPTRVLCGQVKVYQGTPLGFERGTDARPRAVAGSESLPLEEGWYRWEAASVDLADLKLDARTNSHCETVRLGLESAGKVVAFPFMVAGGAALMAFGLLFGLPGGA
jgi:hypothetical protein